MHDPERISIATRLFDSPWLLFAAVIASAALTAAICLAAKPSEGGLAVIVGAWALTVALLIPYLQRRAERAFLGRWIDSKKVR